MTTANQNFQSVTDWTEARLHIEFEPCKPTDTGGAKLLSLSVFVMDHKKRRLPKGSRSLTAYYETFVFEQKRAASKSEARKMALSTAYGQAAISVEVTGREGRSYPLGPVPSPDDIDGRIPAVVVWCDEDMFYLLGSSQIEDMDLLRIANSMY